MIEERYEITVERIPVSRKRSWVFEKEESCAETILKMSFDDPKKAELEFVNISSESRGCFYDEDTKKGWFLSMTLKPSVVDGEVLENVTRIVDWYLELVGSYN